ncbi:MAG: hypothetical protein ABL907_07285 [Hyphomicrobium sp.]
MASLSGSSAEQQPEHPRSQHLTLRWLAKRSALWLVIMTVGICAACGLYALAGEPQAQESAVPAQAPAAPAKG